MSSATDPNVSAGLRQALRRLAKAVVVITAKHNGQRYAMTATAVSELSLAPPSMLICVNQSASMHPPLSEGAQFCINILHQSQIDVAQSCAGGHSGEMRFSVGDWGESESGVPYLNNAQASILCKNDARMIYGTHTVFVGLVEQVFVSTDVNPLLYADGRYGLLSAAG